MLGATLTINKATFTGITFENKTVTYDGQQQAVTITGALPAGAEVAYENNTATNAGTYEATATLTGANYETKVLSATLTINKATFTGITFENKTVFATGSAHSLAIETEGELPVGTQVTYSGNSYTERGEYPITATITNPNYVTLTLNATLYIRSAVDAKNIVDSLLTRPETWSFLPTALLPENMVTSAPVTDFSQAVSVSAIGKKTIGKQLNVLYTLFDQVDGILAAVDYVYAAGESIAKVYQTFINDNPDNYTQFTATITIKGVSCSVKIALQDNESVLLLGNDTVSVELRANSDTNENTCRIQLTDGAALKFKASENALTLAANVEISAVKVAYQIDFARQTDTTVGHLYEYYGVGDKAIKTTALIAFNADYAIVVGNKRETDDLLIEAYEEVYSATTGEYLGGEVSETVKLAKFDTLWFHLGDITGINNVRISPEQNDLNADTVYVNGSSTPFATKKIGGIGADTLSRRFDIEMKEVWYVVATQNSEGETEYERVKTSVPMLFVQNKVSDDFSKDMQSTNGISAVLPADNQTATTSNFQLMKDTYLALKELVSYEEVEAFIGTNDPFFDTIA